MKKTATGFAVDINPFIQIRAVIKTPVFYEILVGW